MAGGAPFAKNCGHCANEVGSDVSRASLSNCGNRAHERCGSAALVRDRVSATAIRTRPRQEKQQFTERVFESKIMLPIGAPFASRLRIECSDPTGFYSYLHLGIFKTYWASNGSPVCALPVGTECLSKTLPMAAALAPRQNASTMGSPATKKSHGAEFAQGCLAGGHSFTSLDNQCSAVGRGLLGHDARASWFYAAGLRHGSCFSSHLSASVVHRTSGLIAIHGLLQQNRQKAANAATAAKERKRTDLLMRPVFDEKRLKKMGQSHF